MEPNLSFGNLIKEHRGALDLTQAGLARRVGCATVTLRGIEYNMLRPSVQIAERLATALNIPLEERAKFIRTARRESLEEPDTPPTPTPPPAAEEINTLLIHAESLIRREPRIFTPEERCLSLHDC